MESKCDVMCLQETKREFFDAQYIKNFCPPRFNHFEILPYVGNSGGSLIAWDGRKFEGSLVFQNSFAQNVEFTCNCSGLSWVLTNIYASCSPEGKMSFLNWFRDISMPDDFHWLIL